MSPNVKWRNQKFEDRPPKSATENSESETQSVSRISTRQSTITHHATVPLSNSSHTMADNLIQNMDVKDALSQFQMTIADSQAAFTKKKLLKTYPLV